MSRGIFLNPLKKRFPSGLSNFSLGNELFPSSTYTLLILLEKRPYYMCINLCLVAVTPTTQKEQNKEYTK